jgi:thiol-disulfide isomerase/thioredoxin
MQSMGFLATVLSVMLLGTATDTTVKLQESGKARVKGMAPSFGGWDLAGKTVLTFDKLRQQPTPSALLLTFGASWCSPCNEGMPRLVALAKKHEGKFRLVLVDVEPDAVKALEFANKHGVDPSKAILDKFEGIAKDYGLQADNKLALPRTFLIDRKGRVHAIYREEGKDLEEVIEADLAAMLAATAEVPAPPVGAPATAPAN